MRVWRLSKRRHAASAFSGEGSRRVSGRWNPVGVPMVYTSSSLSLAVVEVFVHLDDFEELDFVSIAADITVSADEVEGAKQAMLERLPAGWRDVGHPLLQEMGAEWVAAGKTLVLPVPSAVIDGEWNVLVNPAHADAGKMMVGAAKAFHFDERMFKRQEEKRR